MNSLEGDTEEVQGSSLFAAASYRNMNQPALVLSPTGPMAVGATSMAMSPKVVPSQKRGRRGGKYHNFGESRDLELSKGPN